MEHKCNTFSFCQDDYKIRDENNPYEEIVDVYEMYKDIAQFVQIALKNGYQLKMWYDGYSVVIEYNYKEEAISGVTLEWLGEDEYIGSYDEDGDDK